MANIVPRDSGTQMRAMFDRLVGNDPKAYMTLDAAKKHAKATGAVLRASGEGVVIGAVLGIINASREDGLDIRIPGTTKFGAPIDGMASLAFGLAAIASAQEDYAVDFVNASGQAACLYSFRKVSDMVTAINAGKSGITPGGGAAPSKGQISKASFGGEGSAAGHWGNSIVAPHNAGQDPIVVAGMRL